MLLSYICTSVLGVRGDFVLLRIDGDRVPHERRDERGDDGGVEAREGNAGGKRRLLQRLVLHRQPKLVNVHLVRRLEIRPRELQRENNTY